MRKQYLTGLQNRTPEQIAEEEALYIEVKRLEQTERRFVKERDDLLRTLAGIDSGLAGLRVDPDAASSFTMDSKKKKMKGIELDSPSVGSPLGLSNVIPLPKRKDNAKQAQMGMLMTSLCKMTYC
jgi:DNA methyltransferase 1-associated protein 1